MDWRHHGHSASRGHVMLPDWYALRIWSVVALEKVKVPFQPS